jgi:hypothetical protein
MVTAPRLNRQKISTTIAPDTLAYLEQIVESGAVTTLAGAIDVAIARLRAVENRERLERDTAAYFANLNEEEDAEERALESALSQATRGLDFDSEP